MASQATLLLVPMLYIVKKSSYFVTYVYITISEIAGIVYTELLQRSVPCYASDLCENVGGLKKRQDIVISLLQTMCEDCIAVNVNGKYILKEKMENITPDPG